MDRITYKNNNLYSEGVSINDIVSETGTPVYIYSANTILDHYQKLDKALKDTEHLICYSVKVNSNVNIIKLLKDEGSGFDIVSGGELFRVLSAGCNPNKVVFAGVGKTEEEIEYALKSDIMMFNIESLPEADLINKTAERMNKKASVAVRINPDVEAKTHKYITTGTKENKFGLPIDRAEEIFSYLKKLKNINIKGVHSHIGSQITAIDPYLKAISKLSKLISSLRKDGIKIETLNIGGGFGITYNEEKPPLADEIGSAIIPAIAKIKIKLLLEPGRFIVGNCGLLVTKVLYYKETYSKNFIIVDGAMNDLIRPSLYNAYHSVVPVTLKNNDKVTADVVGPVCESGDFFAKDLEIPKPDQGDFLAVKSAGAYGFVMSSNYNSRCRLPEILVDKDKYKIIRSRDTYEDLVRKEVI